MPDDLTGRPSIHPLTNRVRAFTTLDETLGDHLSEVVDPARRVTRRATRFQIREDATGGLRIVIAAESLPGPGQCPSASVRST